MAKAEKSPQAPVSEPGQATQGHKWETVPAWPCAWLQGQPAGMPRRPAYDRCADCFISRTPSTERDTCRRARHARIQQILSA